MSMSYGHQVSQQGGGRGGEREGVLGLSVRLDVEKGRGTAEAHGTSGKRLFFRKRKSKGLEMALGSEGEKPPLPDLGSSGSGE